MATGRPLVISLARYATPIRQYSVSPQSFAAWRARPSAQFMGWFSAMQRRGPILPASVPGGRKGGAEVYTSTPFIGRIVQCAHDARMQFFKNFLSEP